MRLIFCVRVYHSPKSDATSTGEASTRRAEAPIELVKHAFATNDILWATRVTQAHLNLTSCESYSGQER